MSILNKLFENAKPKFSFEAPAKNNEWLDVSIVGIISKEIKKKSIIEISKDMENIINNTVIVYGNEVMGYNNAYLGLQYLYGNANNSPTKMARLRKTFVATINAEKNKDWKITLTPNSSKFQNKLYNLSDLDNDLLLLAQANLWIIKKYAFPPQEGKINVEMDKKIPMIIYRSGMLKIRYPIETRIQYAISYKELEKKVFNEDIKSMYRRIKNDSDEMKLDDETKEWFNQIEVLLKKYDEYQLETYKKF